MTAADVRRVAQQWIDPRNCAIVIVGDRRKIEPQVAALHLGPIAVRSIDEVLGRPKAPAGKPPEAAMSRRRSTEEPCLVTDDRETPQAEAAQTPQQALNLVLGVVFFILGVVGVLLPIVPQIPFFIMSLLFFSLVFPPVRRALRRFLHRHPKIAHAYKKWRDKARRKRLEMIRKEKEFCGAERSNEPDRGTSAWKPGPLGSIRDTGGCVGKDGTGGCASETASLLPFGHPPGEGEGAPR